MAELKTKPNDQSVENFLNEVSDSRKRHDSYTILKLMKQITREEPKMWGNSMIGFGKYHYKYASGREGDWFVTGFSPRKQNLTIYVMSGFKQHGELMEKLGRYKTGQSCLYIKNLEDIDLSVLKKLISDSVKRLSKMS